MMDSFPRIDGIHPIILPPPPGHGKLKTVNMFAVGNGPITLIDAGAKTPEAFEGLKDQLKKAGFGFSDVERLILSHRHGDHVGMASKIRKAAGHPVECFLHHEDERYLSRGSGLGWNEQIWAFFVNAGMPEEQIDRVRQGYKVLGKISDPLDDLSALRDGQVFSAGGHHLKILHCPGHSPGNCCIYDINRKVLFSGDTIVKHFFPMALMELNKERLQDPDYLSKKALMNTLKQLSELEIDFVFPGHGDAIDDPGPLMESYTTYFSKIKARIFKFLKEKAYTIYDLAHRLYGRHEGMAAYFVLSEIMVNLEVLMEENKVVAEDNGPPLIYRALS